MDNQSASLDRIFQALADPTRRAVIKRLGSGSASVKELAEPFDMALPSFLKHITILEECSLIASKKVGRVRTCKVRHSELKRVDGWLSEQRAIWEGRSDRLAQYVETLNAQEPNDGQANE
jgi:DNA-binding transcriptional ArsR family regulator